MRIVLVGAESHVLAAVEKDKDAGFSRYSSRSVYKASLKMGEKNN